MSGVIPEPAHCGNEQVVGTASGCLPSPAETHPIDGPENPSPLRVCRCARPKRTTV